MTVELQLTALLLMMIVGALIAIETSKLLSSIICVGAVGFLLSIAFLILGAPDIAITQIVVEILCLVILIRATISRDLTSVEGDREFFGLVVTVVILLTLVLFSVQMFDERDAQGNQCFPPFGSSVMDRHKDAASNTYVREGLEKTGAANIVTAVLLDFRAYDTLGEATVLFCAILATLAVLRQKARKRREDLDQEGDAA